MKASIRYILFITSTLTLLTFSAVSSADATFSFTTQDASSAATQVVIVDDTTKLSGVLADIDKKTEGRLSKLLTLNEFSSDKGNTLHLQLLGEVDSLLIVGAKDDDNFLDAPELQNLGGKIAASLKSTSKAVDAVIHLAANLKTAELPTAHLAYGYQLRHYSFDRYLSKKSDGVSTLTLVSAQADLAQKKFSNDLTHIASGVHMARDLATEPGKNMYPQAFVDVVKAKFKGVRNVKIEVLDMRDIQKLGMGV